MANISYKEAKKKVFRGLILLGVVTIVEVIFSLFGKGHILWEGAKNVVWLGYLIGVILITLSLYKAYFIIYEFMHMRYETRSLAMSVLLPSMLLIWAIIAFFQEGDSWKDRRQQILEKNKVPRDEVEEDRSQGMLYDKETYHIGG